MYPARGSCGRRNWRGDGEGLDNFIAYGNRPFHRPYRHSRRLYRHSRVSGNPERY